MPDGIWNSEAGGELLVEKVCISGHVFHQSRNQTCIVSSGNWVCSWMAPHPYPTVPKSLVSRGFPGIDGWEIHLVGVGCGSLWPLALVPCSQEVTTGPVHPSCGFIHVPQSHREPVGPPDRLFCPHAPAPRGSPRNSGAFPFPRVSFRNKAWVPYALRSPGTMEFLCVDARAHTGLHLCARVHTHAHTHTHVHTGPELLLRDFPESNALFLVGSGVGMLRV